VGEEFPEEVPPKSEEITIPGDVTPEKVPTHIVDYSSQEQNEEQLKTEIIKSDVVCVVYDISEEEALDKVTSHWLPLVRRCTGDSPKPVVLAGNKADLPYDQDLQTERLTSILNTYTEVETGLECSAKDLSNVSELFYFAQKAVLHPTAPLYSPDERQLKPECVLALHRVFRVFDQDGDGAFNDRELNHFQVKCFDSPLPTHALQEIKALVAKNTINGINEDGLTMEGFLFLHKLFIQRGRHETTWRVLRAFGYSNQLEVKEDYLQPNFNVQPGCGVELSDLGIRFLKEIFHKYDKDKDDALSSEEQEDMLGVCPEYPWDQELIALTVGTNGDGNITEDGFIAFWALQTAMDYTYTMAFLGWMGFAVLEGTNITAAIKEVRPNDAQKTVYQCRLMGNRGSGKTAFIRGLVGKQEDLIHVDGEEENVAIRRMTVAGSPMYLVLHENTTLLEGINAVLEGCDTVGLLYDQSSKDSFRHAVELYRTIRTAAPHVIPCVFIATKSDQPKVEQDFNMSPENFFKQLGLGPPLKVSKNSKESLESAYKALASIARDPASGYSPRTALPSWVKYFGIGISALIGVGAILAFVTLRHRILSN
jgi:GTPase SAR1 family protein